MAYNTLEITVSGYALDQLSRWCYMPITASNQGYILHINPTLIYCIILHVHVQYYNINPTLIYCIILHVQYYNINPILIYCIILHVQYYDINSILIYCIILHVQYYNINPTLIYCILSYRSHRDQRQRSGIILYSMWNSDHILFDIHNP